VTVLTLEALAARLDEAERELAALREAVGRRAAARACGDALVAEFAASSAPQFAGRARQTAADAWDRRRRQRVRAVPSPQEAS
jgi:hypothetical protein